MINLGLFLLGILVFFWALLGLVHADIPGADVIAHCLALVCGICLLLGCYGGPWPALRRP